MILFFIALSPVLVLIILLGVLKIKPVYAALASLFLAGLFAILFFNQNIFLLLISILEGIAITFWPMLIVIFAAFFSYNYVVATGRIEIIKKILFSFSNEKSILVLLLVWGIGNLLEGIAGYGTPIAIPAAILIALGFNPFFSAFICLLANTVSSAYGAVGIPTITLSIITDIDPNIISAFIASHLFFITLLLPFILVIATEKSFKKALKYFPETVAASLGFVITHFFIAVYLGPELPVIVASIVVIILVVFITILRTKSGKKQKAIATNDFQPAPTFKEIFNAFSVYLIILIFIALVSPLFPQLKNFFDSFNTSIKFYPGETGKVITFYWASNPGILILIAVTLIAVIDISKNKRYFFQYFNTFRITAKTLKSSSLTLIALVCFAMIMKYSGMIGLLANKTSLFTGFFYPLFSPAIGALGAFITGSTTSSCILFGEFQKQVAIDLGISEYWFTAANIAGATIGKMIAPHNIALVVAATSIYGQESELFSKIARYCFAFIIILGLFSFFFSDISNIILSFYNI